ncbi:MAG: permease, partial [Maritimibacter sp.]|nr:permease [Maritimibacter sp.]
MDTVIDHDALPRHGRPAPVARSFGWAMLTILGAFLINNILVVWFGFPGVLGIGGEGGLLGWVNLGLYAVAIAGALAIVLTSPNRSLRWDAHLVHNFNVYLVRALFWSIFLVGLFDASIAFLRSENLTVPLFGETLGHLLTRSNFIGPWIHTPLIVLGFVVALFTRTLGFPWLALLIVAA